MSQFWGYPGADTLALIVIFALSLIPLYHARTFVNKI